MEEIHKKNLDPTKPMRHSKKKKWERTKSTAENMIKKKQTVQLKKKNAGKLIISLQPAELKLIRDRQQIKKRNIS